MGKDSGLSGFDRARFGLEAAVIGLTPNVGTGPLAEDFVAEYPAAGIVRGVQNMIEADTDGREQGEESVTEQSRGEEAADHSDPPEGFLDQIDALGLEWESPFVDYLDPGDAEESADTETTDATDTADADADADAGDADSF